MTEQSRQDGDQPWGTTNPFRVSLSRLTLMRVFPNIDRVLEPIGEAIQRSIAELESPPPDSDAEYVDLLVDDETDVIENLLGAALVVCQTYIAMVVSHVRSLHDLYHSQHEDPLGGPGPDKPELIGTTWSVRLPESRCSQVMAIDAAANYFKHRAEWRGSWTRMKGPAAKTVRVLQEAGAEQGSNGNLRRISEALGNPEYHDVLLFSRILREWCRMVHGACADELRTKGVV